MFRCRWEFVVFAAMVAGQRTTAIADELSSPNARPRSVPTASAAEENRQNVNSPLSQPAVFPERGVAAMSDPADARPVAGAPAGPSRARSARGYLSAARSPTVTMDDRFKPPARQPSTVPQQRPQLDPQGAASGPNELPDSNNTGINRVPPSSGGALPSREYEGNVVARKGFDGTWRETPDYVIINIDGREMKLRRSGPDQGRPISAPPNAADGMVQGRLLQNGAPLVNCRVVMMGMEREGLCDEDFEPMTSSTDERGVYRFERVPAGKYKFTWLPEGTKHWIRRIQMKPDVIVRPGQNAVVKDIRAAQRTIN
jgi:hypothetical protein